MKQFASIPYEERAEVLASTLIKKVEAVKAVSGKCRIFVHGNMDGDCIGSGSGMCCLIRMLGLEDTYVVIDEDLPDDMDYMGVQQLLVRDEGITLSSDDLAVAVDCSEGSRMAGVGDIFDAAPNKIIVDHHKSVLLQGEGIWVEPDASSASELCWYVYCAASKSASYREDTELVSVMAMAFLTGIVTDTGRFTYKNTCPETLKAAGNLMALGGDISLICYNQFDRKKKESFLVSAAAQSMAKFYCDGKLAVCVVTGDVFEKFNAPRDGIAEVVSKLRDVEGVEAAFVLRQLENGGIRVNIRSRDYFDCSVYAASFGGGGHMRASGFTVTDMEIHALADRIVEQVTELL